MSTPNGSIRINTVLQGQLEDILRSPEILDSRINEGDYTTGFWSYGTYEPNISENARDALTQAINDLLTQHRLTGLIEWEKYDTESPDPEDPSEEWTVEIHIYEDIVKSSYTREEFAALSRKTLQELYIWMSQLVYGDEVPPAAVQMMSERELREELTVIGVVNE